MISIVLPIHNEEKSIEKCLEAILSQDCDQNNLEILIADGMSTDKTREIIRKYQIRYPQIQLIDNPGQIVSTGLNAAINSSQGDIIVRVDGHTIIAPDYVRQCVETLQRTNADNVGGCMTTEGATNFGKAVALATSTPFGIGDSKFHYANIEQEVDSVYLGAWPRRVFSTIGLFDEELVRDQDDEFNYRLRKSNGKIILNPKIQSVYSVRSTPKALFKQYFQYGLWKIRILQKHPKQMSLRQFIPALFLVSLVFSLVFIPFFRWGLWLLLTIIGSYLIANLSASISITAKNGKGPFYLVSIAFSILHFGYGLGFLTGLVKFSRRWKDQLGRVPQFLPTQ